VEVNSENYQLAVQPIVNYTDIEGDTLEIGNVNFIEKFSNNKGLGEDAQQKMPCNYQPAIKIRAAEDQNVKDKPSPVEVNSENYQLAVQPIVNYTDIEGDTLEIGNVNFIEKFSNNKGLGLESPGECLELDEVLKGSKLKKKNLNRFQIALNPGASYDSMCTNHGVYIKFRGSDNNQLHSSHDSLVEELIDDVGNNVIVFEIPDTDDSIIKLLRDGIILKFDRTTSSLNLYRLCECDVFYSCYGRNQYKKVRRSGSKTGSKTFNVFDFHFFVASLQSGEQLEGRVDICFGDPRSPLLELVVKPCAGKEIVNYLS